VALCFGDAICNSDPINGRDQITWAHFSKSNAKDASRSYA
jgi:hypothetical protein